MIFNVISASSGNNLFFFTLTPALSNYLFFLLGFKNDKLFVFLIVMKQNSYHLLIAAKR